MAGAAETLIQVPLGMLKLFKQSVLLVLVAAAVIKASDPDPTQDFCVADLSSPYGSLMNGWPCKPVASVTAQDFAFSGLAYAANLTNNIFEADVQFGFVRNWPALNTMGLSLARLDLNPGGIIMPHTHNLASEILFCLEGEIYTGFVTTSDHPDKPNQVYAKVVKKGEAFLFPRGLLHFQLNKGNVPAVSLNALNAHDPGIQMMPISLFASGIDPELLTKAFLMTDEEVASLKTSMSPFIDAFSSRHRNITTSSHGN
ncbi:unnamed protein product [Calypogeia fissa]